MSAPSRQPSHRRRPSGDAGSSSVEAALLGGAVAAALVLGAPPLGSALRSLFATPCEALSGDLTAHTAGTDLGSAAGIPAQRSPHALDSTC